MSTQLKWIKTSQIQSLLLLGLLLFFVGHFVLLSPSGLEEDFNGVRIIHPKDLLNFLQNETTTISTVPTNETPAYSLRDIEVFSSANNKPSFRLLARKSNVYQKDQILHGKDLVLHMPDLTVVRANEGVFFINKNEGDVYGDVVTTFPNGTVVNSDYAHVKSKPVTEIQIPTDHLVVGDSTTTKNPVHFKSFGMSYIDTDPQVLRLLSQVEVEIITTKKTLIHSDFAVYQHEKNHLSFGMNDHQPLEHQFVRVNQIDLLMNSRTLEVDVDEHQKLQVITAVSDVFIKDWHDPLHISTATCGRALYYEGPDEIHLNDFPQVYQDNDTVTGDKIVYNRKFDTIEVKQSNAIYKH